MSHHTHKQAGTKFDTIATQHVSIQSKHEGWQELEFEKPKEDMGNRGLASSRPRV
jgi:hypothetical protein